MSRLTVEGCGGRMRQAGLHLARRLAEEESTLLFGNKVGKEDSR